MPGIVGVLLGFITLVVLLVLRLPIWVVLVATATVTSLAGGAGELVNSFVTTTADISTLNLLAITFLIMIFVNLYKITGYIDRLGNELVKLLKKPRLVLILVPAILGLLPVAGGALMSAPIVDSVGSSINLKKDRKLFINVWYRHVIFLFYPISSVIILTATLGRTTVWDIAFRQLPVAAVMIVVGFILGFYGCGGRKSPAISSLPAPDYRSLAKTLTPIMLAVLMSLSTTSLVREVLGPSFQALSIAIGISSALLLLVLLSQPRKRDLVNALTSRGTAELVLAAYGAMLLRTAFTRAGIGGVISGMISENTDPVLLAIVIPAVLAFATGTSLGSIAISLSILPSITQVTPALTALVYATSFSGYLASPLHLCYIYTAQYFRVPFTVGYKYMTPAVVALLASAYMVYFFNPL